MAAGLSAKERADMLVHYIEALVEVFPECRAVVFENSKKMFTREDIVNCNIPRESKFIHYAVNVRFFNIEGTNDKIVMIRTWHNISGTHICSNSYLKFKV